jgi:hypothetical protein
MPTFNIIINASKLFDREIKLIGSTEPFRDANIDLPFDLAPGTYRIAVRSCQSEVAFQVLDDGRVTHDFKGCLEVSGNRITVHGCPVTVDARYVAMRDGKGVLFIACDDWIMHRTINLLPGTAYHVQQGAAIQSSFGFDLRKDGCFTYEPDHDISRGGFLGGENTSTIVFHGYPFLLDATQVGTRVNYFNVRGLEMAENALQFANLLPMNHAFTIGFSGGSVTETGGLGVRVALDGSIKVEPPGTVCTIVPDHFHGLARLRIVKR